MGRYRTARFVLALLLSLFSLRAFAGTIISVNLMPPALPTEPVFAAINAAKPGSVYWVCAYRREAATSACNACRTQRLPPIRVLSGSAATWEQ